MPSPSHPSIQGLIELARHDGVELRPTLVRVLADLYVQEPVHRPVERERFAELVCRLLDGVDTATRSAVAERLAPYPGTPPVVAARLARDEIAVADAVLRRSPVLTEAELHSILDSCGIAHAIAIGARANLPTSVAKRLQKTGARERRAGDPPLKSARIPVAQDGPALTVTLARRYLATGIQERRLILTALPACPAVEHEECLRRIDHSVADQLERAALRHKTLEFALTLRQAAGMPPEIAARVVADPAGDPVVVVCRALDMPFDTTSRILLFLNPAIGASVQQVFTLAEWFETIDPPIARRLVAGWCGLGPGLRVQLAGGARRARERFDSRSFVRLGSSLARTLPPQRAVNHDF